MTKSHEGTKTQRRDEGNHDDTKARRHDPGGPDTRTRVWVPQGQEARGIRWIEAACQRRSLLCLSAPRRRGGVWVTRSLVIGGRGRMNQHVTKRHEARRGN